MQLKTFNIMGMWNDPKYAILSHCWGPEDNKILFEDITDPQRAIRTKPKGYQKVWNACGMAKNEYHCDWIWIDTCCINKHHGPELSEAIASMYE
jgi:hypothetical protein